MLRIVINGRELRRPAARVGPSVFATVAGAVVLASAAAWLRIQLGVGTLAAVTALALALLAGAAALTAPFGGGRRR